MEDVPHCRGHPEKPAEYVCLVCENRPLCEKCKQNHETGTGHMSENLKEVGTAIMHQCIQDGILANKMDKRLIQIAKEFEAGLLQEIDRLQSNCMQTEERCSKMRKLDSERRYAELYHYAKSLTAGGAKSKAVTGERNKHLLEMFDKASKELKNALNDTVAQYKTVFAAYKKDEALIVLEDEFCPKEERVVSALHSADMSKCKAVCINHWFVVGDRVASELASRLQTHPVSALYLCGCDISDAGAEVLAQAAFRGKSLSAFCIESEQISDTGAKAVAEAARNSRSLTMLYLNGGEISDSGAIAVAEAVKGCPLSVFYLAGGSISDAGATAVADMVKSCPLFLFYLGSRDVSDAGATAVADVMKSCPLSAFGLGSSKMSNTGAIAVAKTMKDCPLSAFYLWSREISDSGATAVAEILSSGGCASTLSALFLSSGRISDSGAKKVADAVRGCPRLSAFYLSGKPISGETVAYILEGMADISTIRSVNLRLGEVSKEQMDSCLNRLQQSGVARQLKLRFGCNTEASESMRKKFAAEWNAKLAEFRVVPFIDHLFDVDVILGCRSKYALICLICCTMLACLIA